MIEINVTGLCKGCEFMEPTFSKLTSDNSKNMIFVYCVHHGPCRRIEKLLKQKEKNEE